MNDDENNDSPYERLLDRLHESAREVFGRGISISVDPSPEGGFVARVWNLCGYLACSDETGRKTKVLACWALQRKLELQGAGREEEQFDGDDAVEETEEAAE